MALLATTLLAACSKVPDGILSEKKMQGVLTDMLLAEAMVNVDYNTYKSDTMKLALYESVFRKHDITQAVYDSSLVWYGRNLDIYMEVYNRVLADLNKRINNLGDGGRCPGIEPGFCGYLASPFLSGLVSYLCI